MIAWSSATRMRSGAVPALPDSLLIRYSPRDRTPSVHKKSPQEHELLKAPTPPAAAPSRRDLRTTVLAAPDGRKLACRFARCCCAALGCATVDDSGSFDRLRCTRLRRRPRVFRTLSSEALATTPISRRTRGTPIVRMRRRAALPSAVHLDRTGPCTIMSPVCHRSFPEPFPTSPAAAATIVSTTTTKGVPMTTLEQELARRSDVRRPRRPTGARGRATPRLGRARRDDTRSRRRRRGLHARARAPAREAGQAAPRERRDAAAAHAAALDIIRAAAPSPRSRRRADAHGARPLGAAVRSRRRDHRSGARRTCGSTC